MSIEAKRLEHIKPSATLVLAARAKEMQAEGKDVIGLSIGEPDFETPDYIKDGAKAAMDNGETRYPPVPGTPVLRKAIIAKFKRDNNLTYGMDQIIVSTGGKQVLSNTFLATVDKGDEVIIPAPYWLSYPEMVHLADGTPVIVDTTAETGFKITPQQLEKAITPKTKWVIINSPSNPTGAVYSREELKALAEVLLKHPHVYVLTDDIYEHLICDGLKFHTIAEVEPKLYDRTLTVNGVSKAYAMTGWRLGFAGGPKEVIKAMCKVQGQTTSGASSISQAAAATALNGDQSFLKEWQKTFQERRDAVVATLSRVEGLACDVPQGAFYVFATIDGVIGRKTAEGKVIETDADFCDFLLEKHLVAVVPGAEFGLSPCFRISYALSKETLAKACERIANACAELMASGAAKSSVA